MFALDDQLLADVGLAELSKESRASLLAHVYEELELRVGTQLSDGLSDDHLATYESIMERDVAVITAWLDDNVPDFLDDPIYAQMEKTLGGAATQADVVCEYAATKWLEVTRPDYRDIVAQVSRR